MSVRVDATGDTTVVHVDAGEHGTLEIEVRAAADGLLVVNQRETDGGLRRLVTGALNHGTRRDPRRGDARA